MDNNELTLIIKGKEIKLTETLPGLSIRQCHYPLSNQQGVFNEVSGQGGKQFLENVIQSKSIVLDLRINTSSPDDYYLLVQELDNLITQEEPYYIYYSRYPGIMYLVNPTPIAPNRTGYGFANPTIEFEAFLGYGESRGTTKDKFWYNEDRWAYGMDLPMGEDLVYKHNTRKFKIYNASTMVIDPRKRHFLSVTLKDDGTKKMKGLPVIANKTTGDVFRMFEPINNLDALNITGVYPTLNGEHCGRATNHGLITLAKGWNEIEITGLANFEATFDFAFLYK